MGHFQWWNNFGYQRCIFRFQISGYVAPMKIESVRLHRGFARSSAKSENILNGMTTEMHADFLFMDATMFLI